MPRILADLASEIRQESAMLGRDLLPDAAAELADFIAWVHRAFYEHMQDEFRVARGRDGQPLPIISGSLCARPDEDVAVGRHVPPSSERVADFLTSFEQRTRSEQAGATSRIIAISKAHHRLNYIHPFLDGNGRVSRLMAHAMSLTAGIGAGGLWSISRGLARGLNARGEYKQMMDQADSPRRGDLDGRFRMSRAASSTK